MEQYVSEQVVDKQLYAKIDRPAGIVVFERLQTPAETINSWSADVQSLLSLLEKTTHLIAKENMAHNIQ